MATVELAALDTIGEDRLIALMNDPRVGAQMPLLAAGFSAEQCRAFLAAKRAIWAEHGYGPHGILIDGRFAGWGGLQPEQGDADFALVLHPNYWGFGRAIFERIREQAFGEMGLASITILLPPTRTNARAVRRLGFAPDGALNVGGARFERYRLFAPAMLRPKS